MANYPLSLTGAEIDSALGKVHNADTAPTNASTNMVTSGGVHTAINNLDLTNLAGSSLVTESEGIGGNDNDNTIPTSAAVKDYVDTQATPATVYVSSWQTPSATEAQELYVAIPYGYKASRFKIKYSTNNFGSVNLSVDDFNGQINLFTAGSTSQLPQNTWLNLASYTPALSSGHRIQALGSARGQVGSVYISLNALLIEAVKL